MCNKTRLRKVITIICIVGVTTGCSNVNAVNKIKEESKVVVMKDSPLDIIIEQDKEIQGQLISRVKEMLEIGDEYSNVNFRTMKEVNGQYIKDESDEVLYDISWKKDEKDLKDIGVTLTKDGNIRTYLNGYVNDTKKDQAKVSKEDINKISKEFIAKIYPDIVNKIVIKNIREEEGSGYRVEYVREENGISVYDNWVEVSLNANNGEVTFSNSIWNRNIKFSDNKDIISKEEAKKLFKENIDLQLLYKLDYKNNKHIPDLVYSIIDEEKSIDAQINYDLSSNNSNSTVKKGNIRGVGPGYWQHDKVTLSKNEERDILNNSKEIISKEEAENIAREFGCIDKSYKLFDKNINYMSPDIGNLTTDKNMKSYIWEIQFSKKNSSGGTLYATAKIDGKTKEVLNFDKDVDREKTSGDIKHDNNKSLKIAENFIKKAQPKEFEKTELVDSEGEEDRYKTFYFTRKEDGIYFVNNGFFIDVDSTTGEVIGYNYQWNDVKEFVSVKEIMSKEEVCDILLDNYDLELQYSLPSKYNESESKMARLAYGIKNNRHLDINAKTGKVLE